MQRLKRPKKWWRRRRPERRPRKRRGFRGRPRRSKQMLRRRRRRWKCWQLGASSLSCSCSAKLLHILVGRRMLGGHQRLVVRVAKHDLGVWERKGAGEACVHELPEERH